MLLSHSLSISFTLTCYHPVTLYLMFFNSSKNESAIYHLFPKNKYVKNKIWYKYGSLNSNNIDVNKYLLSSLLPNQVEYVKTDVLQVKGVGGILLKTDEKVIVEIKIGDTIYKEGFFAQ